MENLNEMLSVVMPVYNETGIIKGVERTIMLWMKQGFLMKLF